MQHYFNGSLLTRSDHISVPIYKKMGMSLEVITHAVSNSGRPCLSAWHSWLSLDTRTRLEQWCHVTTWTWSGYLIMKYAPPFPIEEVPFLSTCSVCSDPKPFPLGFNFNLRNSGTLINYLDGIKWKDTDLFATGIGGKMLYFCSKTFHWSPFRHT